MSTIGIDIGGRSHAVARYRTGEPHRRCQHQPQALHIRGQLHRGPMRRRGGRAVGYYSCR